MTIDLSPWAAAVPDPVVAAISSGRNVLIVSHENPDADTLGASLAVARLVEARGGRATSVCTDPPPPLYAFLPGIEAVRTDPAPDEVYDLLVIVDCGSLDRVGAVRHRHRALFAAVPTVVIDHTSRTTATGPPTGSTRPPRRRARWSPCWRPGSASRCRSARAAWRRH